MKLKLEDIPQEKVLEIIQKNISKNNDFIISPLNILKSEGFPIVDQTFVLNSKEGIRKIKRHLVVLEKEGWLIKRKSKQDFKGIKETAYNYIEK